MASRMDRYYQEELTENLRTKKNQNLYREIYEAEGEYSNIEGITSLSGSGKVDLNDIKKLLDQKEEKKEKRVEIPKETEDTFGEEKTYDIRDILSKAKDTKNISNRYHSLKHQDQDFLKDLDLKKEDEKTNQELDELVNTLTNADLLSNFNDDELSLDLLSELKPTGNTISDVDFKNLIKEEAKKYKKEEDSFDQTFFTKEQKFTKEDFAEDDDDFYDRKKSKKGIFIAIGVVLILALLVFLFYQFGIKK